MNRYKNDGLAKGGLIVTLVASCICILVSFAFLIVNNFLNTLFNIDHVETPVITLGLSVKVFNIACEVSIGFFILLVIMTVWALVRPSNKKRIVVGILATISILISWVALFFPVILSLVGAVLILCGRVSKVRVVKLPKLIFDTEPQYLMHRDIE